MGANDTGHIPTLNRELIKTYSEYTGDKIDVIYQAHVNAKDGETCVKTSYEWSGDNIIKMKEELATWDETWEI